MREISIDSARRIAIAAQGLATPRPQGRIDRRHLRKVFDHVGLIQIDSVNVLARSHELVLFARLGNHPRDLIAHATSHGELFEYWGHEAAHIPVEMHPLFRFRMKASEDSHWAQYWTSEIERTMPEFLAEVRARVKKERAIVAGDVRTRTGPKGTWWDWDHGKRALELMFYQGEITAYRRERDFARVYAPLEEVIPREILKAKTPKEDDARRALVARAARSMGVATAKDLADYHRQTVTQIKHLIPQLVEDGALIKVNVEGWKETAYLHRDAKIPRSVQARSLLSPFDSLVWCRPRNERLFDFHYRIEIYTPAAKRVYGYYVLPFLLGDEIVGRVDLKADRQAGVLRVNGAYAERGVDTSYVADHLAAELVEMSEWLGLDSIETARKGSLSSPLRSAVRRR